MPRFLIKVDTGFVGAEHEEEIKIDADMWEGMTEAQRHKVLEDACQEAIANHIEAYWEPLGDDE